MAHVREAMLAARSEIVLASRLAGLPAPIDGVTTAIDDEEMIADDARYAAALGFGGKLCIHPRQIAAVRRGFAPAEADVAWAQRVLAAPEGGAVSVDGMMVDAPVRLRARNILSRGKAVS
jgi:citrate lyase subunit beta/citryl-CoA lyase